MRDTYCVILRIIVTVATLIDRSSLISLIIKVVNKWIVVVVVQRNEINERFVMQACCCLSLMQETFACIFSSFYTGRL